MAQAASAHSNLHRIAKYLGPTVLADSVLGIHGTFAFLITSRSLFVRMASLSTSQIKTCLTPAGFMDSYGTTFSQVTSLATLHTYE